MKIVLQKRDILFISLQLFMFWNFCNGYIRLCEMSLNGTTVPAEIGGSASVEICVCSDTSVYQHIHINHPSHRRGWFPNQDGRMNLEVNSKNKSTTLQIIIKNIKANDFNVVFSVNVYTDRRGWKNTLIEFIVVTFVLEQQQSRLELCQNNMKGSSNGTTVRAEIGGSASVSFCVTSDTTMYNQVFISQPPHRSGWSTGSEKGVDVQFVSEDNYLTVNITIQDITDKDINTTFIVKVCTVKHVENSQTNKGFIILTFVVQEKFKTLQSTTSLYYSPSLTTVTITSTSETTFTERSAVAITDIEMTSTMKQGTESATDKTRADNISPTTVAPTSVCQSQTTLGCPENWLPVKDMCLRVIPREHVCSVYGAELPEETLATYLSACLTYLLENTSSKAILLKSSKYFDVKTKSTKHQRENYQNVCIKAPPNITQFSLETADHPSKRQTLRRDLMNEELPYIILEPTENFLNFTCAANGIPEPGVEIWRDSVTLRQSRGRVSVVINQVTCQDSGVYTCHARNSLATTHIQKKIEVNRPDMIESFTLRGQEHYIKSGHRVEMTCATTKCPGPNTLTIMDDITNIKNRTALGSYLVHEITNVKCSDMGTYTCKAETQDGQILEMKADMIVYGCPVQLCRGEDKSKDISAGIGQTLNISVCVMSSYYQPKWSNIYQYKNISVTFTSRQPGSLYYTANILIYNVQKRDLGTKIIKIGNGYEALDYNITIGFDTPPNITTEETPKDDMSTTTMAVSSVCQQQTTLRCPENWLQVKDMCLRVIPRKHLCSDYGAELPEETLASYLTFCLTYLLENTSTTVILLNSSKYFDVKTKSRTHQRKNYQTVCIKGSEVHDGQGKPVTEAETQPLVIILLLVLLVIVLFVVIGVILYRMRGTLLSRLRERNTGDTSTNNDAGQAEYANLRELDSVSTPAPDRRDEGEQETSVTNYGGQELLLPDISSKDSGRVISEQGLVYVTVAQAANLSKKKKKKPAQSKPKRTRKEPVEPVEYTTLDFEKTGKIVVAEEEDEKKDDGGNQENGSGDQREETGEKQEKSDDKKE